MMYMKVIPVIDVLGGIVVHAKKGAREEYRPIASKLCDDCDPISVVCSFLSLYPFEMIYIADLNAITGRGNNSVIIGNILKKFPGLEFWVDSGSFAREDLLMLQNYTCVVGSESMTGQSVSELSRIKYEFVLSLDFRRNQPLGREEIFENSSLWPEKVIIMDISRVGSEAGVDRKRLEYYTAKWPDTRFIAAGGVRHFDDMRMLNSIGINTCLAASALHSGRIAVDELRLLHQSRD